MKVGDFIELINHGKYLVEITRVDKTHLDEIGIWGNYQVDDDDSVYRSGLFIFRDCKSIILTNKRFVKPKITLSTLKAGDRFKLPHMEDTEYLFIRNPCSTTKFSYLRSDNIVVGTDCDEEVIKVEE